MAVQVSDTFTRADSAVTPGNTETGQAWVMPSGTWGISSNRLYNVDGSGERWIYVESRLMDCTIKAEMPVSGDGGIWFRTDGSPSSGWFFNRSGVGYELYKIGSGLQGSYATTALTTDIMKVELLINNIKCYVNDTLAIEVNDSAFNANSKHGFRLNNSVAGRFDNFSIETPVSFGTSFELDSVEVIDSTHIRVHFTQPMKNNQALIQTGNYVITPTLTVFDVVPEAVLNPTYVTLTVSEQINGTSYELEAQVIEVES